MTASTGKIPGIMIGNCNLPWDETLTITPGFFSDINFLAIIWLILTIGFTFTAHNLKNKDTYNDYNLFRNSHT